MDDYDWDDLSEPGTCDICGESIDYCQGHGLLSLEEDEYYIAWNVGPEQLKLVCNGDMRSTLLALHHRDLFTSIAVDPHRRAVVRA